MNQELDWRSAEQAIPADHPCLAGHFPGRPVVPGVLLLDHVVAALAAQRPGWQVRGIPNVKFLHPLLPEQSFTISLQGQAPRLNFQVDSGGQRLAQGQLETRV